MASGETKRSPRLHKRNSRQSDTLYAESTSGIPAAKVTMIGSGQSCIFPPNITEQLRPSRMTFSKSLSHSMSVKSGDTRPESASVNNYGTRPKSMSENIDNTMAVELALPYGKRHDDSRTLQRHDTTLSDNIQAFDKQRHTSASQIPTNYAQSSRAIGSIQRSIPVKKQTQFLKEPICHRVCNISDNCPTLTFVDNKGVLEIVLEGTEKVVIDGIKLIRDLEKNIYDMEVSFPIKIMSELHKLSVESPLNEKLKVKFPECVVRQEKNKMHVYGFGETTVRKANIFISGLIIEYTSQAAVILRKLQYEMKTLFCNDQEQKLLVSVDREWRAQFIGLKEAVIAAIENLNRLNREKEQTNTRTPIEAVKYLPLDNEIQFQFLEKCVGLESIKKKFYVNIIYHRIQKLIEISGNFDNVKKAFAEIESNLNAIYCDETIELSQPSGFFFGKNQSKTILDEIEQNYKVCIEKEVVYHAGSKCVTKQQSVEEIVWLGCEGKELILQINNMDAVKASVIGIPRLDESKGQRFSRKCNTIEVPVPPWVNGNSRERSKTEQVAKQLLSKVSYGKETTLAISLEPFSNWPYDEYMKCFANSSIEWLLELPDVLPRCVILFTESMDHVRKLDTYVEQCVTDWQKDVRNKLDLPVIRVLKHQLDQTEADVIVNTTGPNLDLSVGNVSAALLKAVGPDLQRECNLLYKDGITPHQIAITKSFNLMCKQLFHITLPYFVDDKQCIESIRNAVILCLKTAAELRHETVAFPIIGSGNLAYPIDLVCSEMFGSVERHRQDHPDTSIKEVRFVVHPKDTMLYEKFKHKEEKQKTFLRELKSSRHDKTCEVKIRITGMKENVMQAKVTLESKGKEIYTIGTMDKRQFLQDQIGSCQLGVEVTDAQENEKYTDDGRPAKMKPTVKRRFSLSKDVKNLDIYENGSLLIKVYEADILIVPTEGIVNAANEDLQHIGGLASAIAKHAGKQLEKESRDIMVQNNGKLNVSSVVCTSGGNLQFKYVLHAVGPRWRDYKPFTEINLQNCADDLKQTFLSCLRMAESKRLKTVAVPTISSGIFKVPKNVCAVQYARAILEFGDSNRSLKEVHIIDKDSDMIKIVHKIFYTMLTERKPAPKVLSEFIDTPMEQTKTKKDCVRDDVDKSFEFANSSKRKANMENHSTFGKSSDVEDCVICMDKITEDKKLKCGHIFCKECIDGYFRVKMVCPTCGNVCGVVTGDQPSGEMKIEKNLQHVTGYEGCKSIAITYLFENGRQGPDHPKPGNFYKGISRTAYLPDNEEGRKICAMLKVAFERRLVFTIGTSRTTGKEGVITWNDIHHKTDMRPYSQFGYPDATYLQRVTEELVAKGVTIDDVDDNVIEQLRQKNVKLTIRS